MRVAHARRAARRPPSSVSGSSGWLWRRPPSAGTLGSESLASVSVPAAGRERWRSRRLGNKYTSGVRSLPYPLCLRHFLLPSFLSPFFFFPPEASPARSRGTLVPSLFWWIFVFFRLVWFARSPKSPSGPGSGTPCRGSRPHVEVSGLRFAWPTWVPRLRGLLVLGKPAVLLQCWFAGKPIFTLWLRKERNIPTRGGSRGSPGHYCVRAWCRVL